MFADDRQLSAPLILKGHWSTTSNHSQYVLRTLFPLTHGILSRRRTDPAFLYVRNQGRVPERPPIAKTSHPAPVIHENPPAFLWTSERAHKRMRYLAPGRDHLAGRDRLPVPEHDPVARDIVHTGLEPHFY